MHPRVLVVTASMGGGHVAAADELARRVREGGGDAEVIDVLAIPRRVRGRALRGFYHQLVRRAPAAYGAVMRAWERWPPAFERLTLCGSGVYERGLLAAIERTRPNIVVSTFNLASQVLGALRASGRLRVPVVTYVTDPGPHPYWVAEGVDGHLAVLEETAAGLVTHGARNVGLVAPLVRPQFALPRDPVAARRTFGLPLDVRVAVVSAGTWGVGDVERTVRTVAREPLLPVTLCGRDEDMRADLARSRLGRPLGWTDRMPELFAGADVLVDNAGGLTCWEALVSGLPVVMYRPIPGHGRDNAAAVHAAGLATWARDAVELRRAVAQARRCPPGRLLERTPVEQAVLERAW